MTFSSFFSHIKNFLLTGTYLKEFQENMLSANKRRQNNIAYSCDNYVGNYFAQKIVDLHPEYYEELCSLLKIKEPDHDFIRLGRDNDGGYILIDDFKACNGIAYSLGIADDISFDEDIAKRGYDVFMYDCSIQFLPESDPRFHFFNYKIGNGKDAKSLHAILAENNHLDADNMLLKMDIEGFEYELIYNTPAEDLNKFSQIVIEFHDITQYTNLLVLPVLKKLNALFQPVHIHGQDVSPIVKIGDNKILPYYIEVTYLNKSVYSFSERKTPLPLTIDMPTYAGRRELYLGDFY